MNFWPALQQPVLLIIAFIAMLHTALLQAQDTQQNDSTGFLVVAADRGFVGNEEIRDAFENFEQHHNAALVFVTDERTNLSLTSGLASLQNRGAKHVVVLPLFLSTSTPRYQLVRELLIQKESDLSLSFARAYGESYVAVEELAGRMRATPSIAGQDLLIVGYGARDEASQRGMQQDWEQIVQHAANGLDVQSIQTLILPERGQDEDGEAYFKHIKQLLATALKSRSSTKADKQFHVLPFAFGPRHDSMMSLEARLTWLLPEHAKLVDHPADPKYLTTWMTREANRSQSLTPASTGVILFAHGSDFHWNENLRTAVQPLMERYLVEFAFSMADPGTIERALRKLEQRGAKTAIIVSAYATGSSFRKEIEQLTGLDFENRRAGQATPDNPGKHTDHGHHGKSGESPSRILTTLPVIFTGGYDDHPLFATALLDRALALSSDPAKETVIVVAHGTKDDQRNLAWLKKLEGIAQHMRHNGGQQFKAIQVATWREDWPDKRAPWIEKVRNMVMEASKHDGRAIVIPARTTATGPEKRFLAGLQFELGSGFAPHPLFTQWVDEQIQQGMQQYAQAMNH